MAYVAVENVVEMELTVFTVLMLSAPSGNTKGKKSSK